MTLELTYIVEGLTNPYYITKLVLIKYKIIDISDKIFIRHNENTELTTKLAFIYASVSKQL